MLLAGLVTKAKSQGTCGSCAAFASIGSIETCMLKAQELTSEAGGASKDDLDLSEQWLLNCAYRFYKKGSRILIDGCEGAWPQYYAQWFVEEVNEIEEFTILNSCSKN